MKIIVLKFPHVHPNFCAKICDMVDRLGYDLEGIVSLDLAEKFVTYNDHPIYQLADIGKLTWDVAVYACEDSDFVELLPRMVELGIGKPEQFKNRFWLLKQHMIAKYEDFADPVIQETLEYWKTHELSVFNQHVPKNRGTFNKVFFDEDCKLPYIFFKTDGGDWRKMYYPPDTNFYNHDGENVVMNILNEQWPTSPHLYVTDTHRVHEGDVIIDAGVCEGNFALRYVDICSKMYLFESDEKWAEVLRHTFKDYGDKVEIIQRYVSNVTDDENITLDDAVPDLRGKNIFLKMDIEGAEPRALRGAKKLLAGNKVRASICTYHTPDDLVTVKGILRGLGYETSVSAGYMVFIINPNILDTADFRKGIVYAAN